MTKDDALKLALEALTNAPLVNQRMDEAVDAIEEALAPTSTPCEVQPEQEPAAWHDKIVGMEVSMDVSTGEDDAHHRVFGRVCEVMLEASGATNDTILAIEDSRNFTTPLAQPEQGPVAEVVEDVNGCLSTRWYDDWAPNPGDKLYTTPLKREWVELTDEEIEQGCKESWVTEQAFQSAVWWAEAKLKEKNNG